MSTRIDLLTPVGRLVQGNLYSGATTDAENRPLVYKTGANAGQPRVNFWFNLALAKGTETHWSQTVWGKKIYDVGHAGFPNGQPNSPHFAWKIIDGDSQIPNTQGNKPCDNEGFPGHWILKFSGSFAPSLYNDNGTLPLTEPNAIQLGDYIQVYGYVEDNKSTQQPGIYLNHSMVALAGYGQRIIAGADPKTVGFGGQPLPFGASTIPIASFTPPMTTPAPHPSVVNSIPPMTTPAPHPSVVNSIPPMATPVSPPPPYPQILTPEPQKQIIITEKANGATYEQLISVGWTDDLLIQHGVMLR